MTNNTEQQAVPVAQEFSETLSARLRVSARHAIEGNWGRQTAERLYEAADAFDRLASHPCKSGEGAVVERMAKVLGLHRFPGGNGANNPPTRWPTGPTDTLSGRDGTVPLTWDFAETCRAEVRAMLVALTPDATQTREAKGDTVKFVQDWLMNADYDPTQFDKDFAAAIDARKSLTDAELQAAAERFCATPLPDTVCADLVAIKPMSGRTGTNLMTVAEAKEMLRAALNARGGA